jgi:hypothetical protein
MRNQTVLIAAKFTNVLGVAPPKTLAFDDYLEKTGAAEGTRTPDPIITNDVLYQLSYSGFLDPTMALLVLLLCLELVGFASH